MRLDEEKSSVRLNLISVVAIIISTILIQISDHYIQNNNNALMVDISKMLQKELFKMDHKMDFHFYSAIQAFGMKVEKNEIDQNEKQWNEFGSTELEEMHERFINGQISSAEYIDVRKAYHKNNMKKYIVDYNKIWKSIREKKVSIWDYIKKFSIVAQIIGVLFLIHGYWKLYSLISNRVSKKQKT